MGKRAAAATAVATRRPNTSSNMFIVLCSKHFYIYIHISTHVFVCVKTIIIIIQFSSILLFYCQRHFYFRMFFLFLENGRVLHSKHQMIRNNDAAMTNIDFV